MSSVSVHLRGVGRVSQDRFMEGGSVQINVSTSLLFSIIMFILRILLDITSQFLVENLTAFLVSPSYFQPLKLLCLHFQPEASLFYVIYCSHSSSRTYDHSSIVECFWLAVRLAINLSII